MKNIISVIVCTYNQEHTIARALDSILRQECSWPIEIIIGDDCSADCTSSICEDYARRFPDIIRHIRHENNKGILENYVDCLLLAQGKYIADLAGDDEWIDNKKLEKQRLYMEQHADCVMLHTDYLMRDNNNNKITNPEPYPYNTAPAKGEEMAIRVLTQRYRPAVHLCTAMYRNDAFCRCYEKHRKFFRNNSYPCEDMQLTALMAYEGTTDFLPTITLAYTTNHNSISNSKSEEKAYRFKKAAAILATDLRDYLHLHDNRVEKALNFRIYELLMHAFRLNDKQLRKDVIDLTQQRGIKLYSLRTAIVLLLTSNSLTWTLTLWMRRKYLS